MVEKIYFYRFFSDTIFFIGKKKTLTIERIQPTF